MTVEYAEMDGYPKGQWLLGDFEGQRRLKVAWVDVYDLLVALEWTSWPYYDADYGSGDNSCYPYRADIKPFPGGRQGWMSNDDSLAYYEYAMVDVYYTTKGGVYDAINKWRYEINIEPYTRMQRVEPTHRLAWDKGGRYPVTRTEAPMSNLHGLKLKATYSGLTKMPTGAFGLVGCVNSNRVHVSALNATFPSETLLYGGSSINLSYQWGYLPRWSVTYNSFYWPAGHNMFYHPQYGFQPMYVGSNIYKLYPSTYFPSD